VKALPIVLNVLYCKVKKGKIEKKKEVLLGS
jgi:hypothetical protein